MQYVSSSSRNALAGEKAAPSTLVNEAAAAESRQAMMQAKLGARVDLNNKIRLELIRIAFILVGLTGLGIYAWDFVYNGIMAKAALNLTIVGVFILAAGIAVMNVWNLRNDKIALDALRADFGSKRPSEDIVNSPATIFKKPKLLGYGYRLVTEELLARDKGQLPTETIHIIVQDVDHKIKDAAALLGYFGGLLVFLGLLGAFMGLMKTVSSVGELIGSLDMSGEGGSDAMGAMIEGMKKPLHGMSVGFSSSLFGLLFSMVVGVLDRFAGSAMKAVRNEFEACLIDLAHLEMADHEAAAAGAHGAVHVSHSGSPMDAELVDELVRQMERSHLQAERTNDLLSSMNATLYALTSGLRQNEIADGRRELATALEGVARSQRDLAMQLTTLAQDEQAQQERIANALQASVRTQEEVHGLLQDLSTKLTGFAGGGGGGNGSSGSGASGGGAGLNVSIGGGSGGSGGADASSGVASEVAPTMIGRARPQQPGSPLPVVSPLPQGHIPHLPGAPTQAADPNETGARALMARLAFAIGQRQPGGLSARATSDERHKQLERAMMNTQQMSRQVLRRLDDTRREEARTAVAINKAQRQVITSLDMLVKRLDELMEGGEIVAKGRIERLGEVMTNTKAQVEVSIDRLEAQVTASRRTSERAEMAAAEAARAARASIQRRKAVGD